MVRINGEQVDVAGTTIAQYIKTTTFDIKKIAVERNGDIVPKTQYEKVMLSDDDVVEIVSFVGGG